MVNTDENTGVFLRDVDKLMHQYRNLRVSIYNQFKGYLPDPVTREELRSYIDEQFIRLVKEYDINGPVDFPGYIKKKLTYRVKHSYIKSVLRDNQRVFLPKSDIGIFNLIEQNPKYDEELDYYETLEYVLNGVELEEIEKEVLYYLLQEMADSQIEKEIKNNHEGEKLSSTSVKNYIKDMKDFLKTKLNEGKEM